MARRPLIAAAFCAAVAMLVYAVAVHVPAAQRADLRVLDGFTGLHGVPGARWAPQLFALFNPLPYVLLLAAVVGAGWLSGRRREGVAAGVAMASASITTELLKPLLASPRPLMEANAWPSGHTTAVMSFALALVLISGPRLRPFAAAFGGVLTLATVFSMLLLGRHYPSDVLGGFCVATGWNCLAAAALRADALPSLRALVAGPAIGAALLVAVIAAHPAAALAYAAANTTFVAGALTIAAGALVLSGSVPAPTAARRRPPPGSPRARG